MKVHHIGYLTGKLERTEEGFLRLGYEIERPIRQDTIRQVNIEFLVNGPYRVELIEPTDKDSPLYPLLDRYKNVPYHFCYETENFDDDIKRLIEEDDYVELQPPEVAPCIDNARVCFLYKKSVGIIELIEIRQ